MISNERFMFSMMNTAFCLESMNNFHICKPMQKTIEQTLLSNGTKRQASKRANKSNFACATFTHKHIVYVCHFVRIYLCQLHA